MTSLSTAERLLLSLGVETPEEIDLEAIAWTLGVKVRYARLDKCEARIAGSASSAIVTIRSDASPGRKRFSLGHELGHWHRDRGKTLVCRQVDIGNRSLRALDPERIADDFAADLLMPSYMFEPEVRKLPKLNFAGIRKLAERYNVSLTAAAIRAVEKARLPTLLVCHREDGRAWFTRSSEVPERWFPQRQIDRESPAFDVLSGKMDETPLLQKINADAWFDTQGASWYEIREQSVRISSSEILTLLVIEEERMLREDGGSRSSSRERRW
ncbi:protein of unknown function DUF955 [Nitrobacter hamburgensis X14]|uniref:IrrE N-terminal-like domain-containing protein n=1 Tax=Nitrobacter hamburgensis (strain DSM 10229 / NCIMB 13809 / X14) TaxID=323097 RepID=Q1QNK0_NITHX|nr:ImmA/IrrE family metallo-endopeptidase [Nitrobacter hamburgensis]ABE62197.1 protein of unknown function DUF955 [Nitrobacter hamburgensis X14]